MKRLLAAEAIFNAMEARKIDDEDIQFENILRLCTDIAVEGAEWNEDVLEAAARICGVESWAECFMTWKFFTAEYAEDLAGLLLDLVAEGRNAIENGVSFGEGVGVGSDAADRSEPAGDADVFGDGAAGVGCAESEAGADQAELLDHRAEDEETAADWLAGAAAVGLAQERGQDVGVSGEEPGEASDETGGVEGRKTCFGSLPPMSECRTSLYAQSVCRGTPQKVW